MSEKNLQKLQEIMKLLNEGLTKEEFVKSFKVVVNQVLAMEKKMLERDNERMRFFENLASKLESGSTPLIEDLKKKTMDYCMSEMEKMTKEHEMMMDEVEEKIENVQDGVSPDPKDIIKEVLKMNPPETAEETRDKIESLKGDQRLDRSAIKGLEELEKTTNERIDSVRKGRIIAPPHNLVQYHDMSSQCNGSLKTFTTPNFRHAVMLIGTQAPILYRPTIDFTIGAGTIILTSEVSAPATGQTLVLLYIK